MKTANEIFLVPAFSLFWLIVLPLAGLFEIAVILSDRIGALKIHHTEMATS